MSIKRCIFALILFIVGIATASSQQNCTEMSVDFRVNSTTIDLAFSNNAKRLLSIHEYLQKLSADTATKVTHVYFCGAASPEGSYQFNHGLARERLGVLEKFVRDRIQLPDSIITYDDSYISWDFLREQVMASDINHKEAVLAIIDGDHTLVDYLDEHLIDSRIPKLQQIDEGTVWRKLMNVYFDKMRNATVVFMTYTTEQPVAEPAVEVVEAEPVEEIVEPAPVVVEETEIAPVVVEAVEETVAESVIVAQPQKKGFFALKANLLIGAASIANLGFEVALGKKWSLDVPVYYSPYNITPTRKCRILATQPEVRFWPAKAGSGHFIGLHGTVGFFNIAINDHGRYQDPDSPAWGCGLGYGYALNFGANKNWGLEFNLGLGVVKYKYDVYYNRENGQKFDSGEGWWWGPTRAGITLTYKWWWPRTPKTKEVKL